MIFPSLGMWASTFRTPELLKACMRASNEWALEEVARCRRATSSPPRSPRSWSRTRSRSSSGRRAGLQVGVPADHAAPERPDWHRDDWEPFWAAAEGAGMVLAIHIGTDPVDLSARRRRSAVTSTAARAAPS